MSTMLHALTRSIVPGTTIVAVLLFGALTAPGRNNIRSAFFDVYPGAVGAPAA